MYHIGRLSQIPFKLSPVFCNLLLPHQYFARNHQGLFYTTTTILLIHYYLPQFHPLQSSDSTPSNHL